MAGSLVPFRFEVRNISPPWLRNGTGERLMYCFGGAVDARLEKVVQGTNAHLPLRAGTDALDRIGDDRLILRGITENNASFGVRLQRALDDHRIGGTSRAVLAQALGYVLSATPTARFVSTTYALDIGRMSRLMGLGVIGTPIASATNASPITITTNGPHGFTTGNDVYIQGAQGNTAANGAWLVTVINDSQFTLGGSTGNGTYTGGGLVVGLPAFPTIKVSSIWDTYPAGRPLTQEPVRVLSNSFPANGNWDWDSASQVTGSYSWWGAWLILYSVAPNAWISPAPKWGTGVKWGSGIAWGTSSSANVGRGLQAIAAQFKSANTWIRSVMISFDATLFDPSQPPDGVVNPDGTFGRWSKVVNGVRVRARFPNVAYGGEVI